MGSVSDRAHCHYKSLSFRRNALPVSIWQLHIMPVRVSVQFTDLLLFFLIYTDRSAVIAFLSGNTEHINQRVGLLIQTDANICKPLPEFCQQICISVSPDTGTAPASNWKSGDMNTDEQLDARDLTLMKRALL